MRLTASVTLMGVLAVLSVACGGTSPSSGAAGTLGAACLPNDTCNSGLRCSHGACVAGPPCAPDTSVCDGQVAVSCGADGEVQSQSNCSSAGLTCSNGSCVSPPTDCMTPRLIESRFNQPLPGSVAVVFAVDSCGGAPVVGLTSSDFAVFEDGTPVSAAESSVTLLQRPVEVFVSLVLDNSPSVANAGTLASAVAAAKSYAEVVLSGGTTVHVRIGVFYFSKNLVQVLPWTNDLAAVLAAIDGLATDTTGSNTTNLYGALIDALAASDTEQRAQTEKTDGGVTTLGQVVLFTDGSDQAALKTLEDAQAAVAASHDDVLAVAVGQEVRPEILEKLATNGVYLASSPTQLANAFSEAAKRTAALQRRLYVLGYCSPKLAGTHELTVELQRGAGHLGPIAFDAASFDSGTEPGCSGEAFAHACDGQTCGGLLCGNCGKLACQGCSDSAPCIFSLACDPQSKVCKPPEAIQTGALVCDADCGPLAQCPGCVIRLDGGSPTCGCASSQFAEPTCRACIPHFAGPSCDRCDESHAGAHCDECSARFSGPNCDVCIGNFTGPECDQCKAHFAGPDCEQCAANFTGPDCKTCVDGFRGSNCNVPDRGQGLCEGVRDCVFACTSTECADACVADADSPAEAAAFQARDKCLADNQCFTTSPAPTADDVRAFYDCERKRCLFEFRTCDGGDAYTDGGHSCGWIVQCDARCAAGDYGCTRACYASGTELDASEYAAYHLCLMAQCSVAPSPDAATCVQRADEGACADVYAACYGF